MSADLIKEIERISGPSRRIDALVYVALHPEKDRFSQPRDDGKVFDSVDGQWHSAPELTVSIDAVLAFKELAAPHLCVENFSEMRDSGPLTGHWLAQLSPRGPRKRVSALTAGAIMASLDGYPLVSAPTPAHALTKALAHTLLVFLADIQVQAQRH